TIYFYPFKCNIYPKLRDGPRKLDSMTSENQQEHQKIKSTQHQVAAFSVATRLGLIPFGIANRTACPAH
ncbi:MAG: hypothetical protein P8X95_27090, partial [Anaerolineales bacterium]